MGLLPILKAPLWDDCKQVAIAEGFWIVQGLSWLLIKDNKIDCWEYEEEGTRTEIECVPRVYEYCA